MKKRDYLREARAKNAKALIADLREAEKQLISLRFSLAFHKLKNVKEIQSVKKRIAQIQTILREQVAERSLGKES